MKADVSPGAAAPDTGLRKLPRKDYLLLPILSLLTAILVLSICEVVAWAYWPDQQLDACMVQDAKTGLPRFLPNCKSRVKIAEGPWVDNVYNDCGYRTRESCQPRPQGTLRVAILGTSFSYGYMTPYNDVYTTLASQELSQRCAKSVEFQNLGFPNRNLVDIYRRTNDALALKPDMILLSISPVDVRKIISTQEMVERNAPPHQTDSAESKSKDATPKAGDWIKTHLVEPLRDSRAVYVAQHFLYQNPNSYLDLYLLYGDSAGYVRTPASDTWQQRYASLATILTDMKAKAKAAGIPLVVFLGPQPSQVALVNTANRPSIDPYAFGNEVSNIGKQLDVPVVDPLSSFKDKKDPMSLFYVVDGHLNAEGQRVLSDALTSALLSSNAAHLPGCNAGQH